MSVDMRGRILELHRKGVPSSHIARKLGVPRKEVNHVIKEASWRRTTRK